MPPPSLIWATTKRPLQGQLKPAMTVRERMRCEPSQTPELDVENALKHPVASAAKSEA